MAQIVNLTPHAINIVTTEGTPILTIEPSGQLARVTTKTVVTGHIYVNGVNIPATETQFGEVEGLPEPQENTIYVVSQAVASRCKNRWDVRIPNESVRDDKGRIVGCRSLGRV